MENDRRSENERRSGCEKRQKDDILCETVPGGILLTGNNGGAKLVMQAEETGKDWTVIVTGGEAPHIGCAVLAIPRESLLGDGKRSSTSSVLNVTGHKDEEICRYAAEKLAAGTGRTVVCTGGIHIDGITQDQIGRIRDMAAEMTERLVKAAVLKQDKEKSQRGQKREDEPEYKG